MARRIEHIEAQAFDVDAITLCHTHGHNVRVGLLAHDCDAMRAVAQSTQSSDVVSVQMSVHGLDQSQIELTHQLQIPVNLFQHRINDQRLAAMPASEEISVGARNAVKELAEDHRRLRYIDRTPGASEGQTPGNLSGRKNRLSLTPPGKGLRSYILGCGTIRMYGLGAFQPCGYCFLASSSLTEPAMITSSPCFQFTGVATLCFAVSWSESITRSTSSKFRPVVIGYTRISLIFLSGPITKTLRTVWLSAGVRPSASPSTPAGSIPYSFATVRYGSPMSG